MSSHEKIQFQLEQGLVDIASVDTHRPIEISLDYLVRKRSIDAKPEDYPSLETDCHNAAMSATERTQTFNTVPTTIWYDPLETRKTRQEGIDKLIQGVFYLMNADINK